MEDCNMQQPLSEWLDLLEAERTTGIRADALRKAARSGKLRTVRVAGPRGPHLVHKDDLRLYDSDEAAVTLVTCYPRLRYDHRFVVTATLVGVKG